jgi:hypothetical protein
MESDDLDNPVAQKKWSARLLTISGSETMSLRALDAVAYNNALLAMYSDPEILRASRQHVTWFQRRLRHLCGFYSTTFPLEADH